jgi:hypothetical protein
MMVLIMMSKGFGKNQKAIMEYLSKYQNYNVSVRYLAQQIYPNDYPTKKQINTVRNSVKRLGRDNLVDTITCSVFSKKVSIKPGHRRFYPSQITMVRFSKPGLKYRVWNFTEPIRLELYEDGENVKV